MFQMLVRGINFFIRILDKISAVFLGLMAVYITVHALLRYTLGRGLPSMYPIIQNLMVIVVFFALAQAQVEKQHIRITFVRDKLSDKAAKGLDIFVYIVAVMFLFWMFWGGKASLQECLEIKEYFPGSIPIPAFPARLAVVIGSIFIFVRFLVEIIEKIIGSRSSKN